MEKTRTDNDNLMLIQSPQQVDDLNSAFYSRFPYPWRPQTFDFVDDPNLHAKLLNQNIGNWELEASPANPKIWVAGCGTYQAIYTALRFSSRSRYGIRIFHRNPCTALCPNRR